MTKVIYILIFTILLALIAGTGAVIWKFEHRLPEVSYNEFLLALENGEVREVRFQGAGIAYQDVANRSYSSYVPDVSRLLPILVDREVAIYGDPERASPLWNILSLAVPAFFFFLIVLFLLTRGEREGEEENSKFIRDKAIHALGSHRHVTFRDVAGMPEAKEELLEIVDFLQKPKKYSQLGAVIPKGILFVGLPGTGKTLLARAVAGEAGVSFYSISGSDFVEMFVGVGASRVRDLFREAKKNAPCIIFIDEIDAVGGLRGSSSLAGGQEERAQTLNALLVEMDGFRSEETIIVLAATNRPDILDPALLRPGRFDRQIATQPPDVGGRKQILQVHLARVKGAPTLDLDGLARATPGFTGADLANLVNEAAILAGRKGGKEVAMEDFEMAEDRILLGVERRGLVISQDDRRTMAYHEAGHAVLAKFLPEADPLHKITIIPRGMAMGHTQQLPLRDRHAYSEKYLRSRIVILMGGRAAEELIFNDRTTGAANDFRQAVQLARNMVAEWGMNPEIGPLSYGEGDRFLPGSATPYAVSPETAALIDREVKKLVEGCHGEAVELLQSKKPFLTRLAETLLETESLDREAMEKLFAEVEQEESGSSGAATGSTQERRGAL